MRIWSLHPRHLDRQGLIACWRETLLAQAVLAGRTRGYQHHPQLARFRAGETDGAGAALELIGSYLGALADDADRRGYRFDRGRILQPAALGIQPAVAGGQPATPAATGGQTARRSVNDGKVARLTVTDGQLALEWAHLLAKLRGRSPADWERSREAAPSPHPLFGVVPGPVEPWERAEAPAAPAETRAARAN